MTIYQIVTVGIDLDDEQRRALAEGTAEIDSAETGAPRQLTRVVFTPLPRTLGYAAAAAGPSVIVRGGIGSGPSCSSRERILQHLHALVREVTQLSSDRIVVADCGRPVCIGSSDELPERPDAADPGCDQPESEERTMNTNEPDNANVDRTGISRRSLLGAAAAGSAGAVVAGAVPAFAARKSVQTNPRRPLLPVRASQPRHGTVLSLLGTSGGPPPDYVRAGISSALTVGGKNYVVDAGRSSTTQYINAGLRFSDLQAIFIGALHADHIADYYNYFMLAGMKSSEGDQLSQKDPIKVLGPGSGAPLPPSVVPPTPTPIAPQDPAPGITDMTNQLNDAYAYSNNIFIREQDITPITTYTAGVKDIPVPDVGQSSTGDRAPNMDPFGIYQDDYVNVTATLVPLGLCYPSFAFRFDTDQGSVVFSQDNRPSQNLITLAQGADILVHETMDYLFYKLRGASKVDLEHFRNAHTFTDEVGPIAEQAGVDTLVLTHLSPSNPRQFSDERYLRKCSRGFSGKVIVGNDLDRIPLRAGKRA